MGADADPSGGFLASTTPLLGLPLYALLTISAAALVFALLFFSLRRCSRSRGNRRFAPLIPTSTKEIAEITPVRNAKGEEEAKKVVAVVKPSEGSSSSSSASSSVSLEKEKKMENIGWGRWYTLAELEAATAGFNSENVIGEGGYGIVYRGVLPDLSIVAVKNLLNNNRKMCCVTLVSFDVVRLVDLNLPCLAFKKQPYISGMVLMNDTTIIPIGANLFVYGKSLSSVFSDDRFLGLKARLNIRGQAEKEFKVEVEAIGKVRHKNLVGLIGYCAEGAKRMLVYEYIDNGTLEQWLHGDVGLISPLTWDIRMKIAIGTAKGIAYLHEGLEPKVVHRDIKSSNILLNKQWYPKVSDFGLAKVLGSGSSYVTTRVMGTFGYVAPEYACTGMLNESSDVYSFGVLLMEIISGRSPVDYNRPVGEVNMVEWFKRTVQRKHDEEVLDPSIEVKPSTRALKRVLLICLRCIDMDAQKRPKMGQIIHMLEGDEFPFRIVRLSQLLCDLILLVVQDKLFWLIEQLSEAVKIFCLIFVCHGEERAGTGGIFFRGGQVEDRDRAALHLPAFPLERAEVVMVLLLHGASVALEEVLFAIVVAAARGFRMEKLDQLALEKLESAALDPLEATACAEDGPTERRWEAPLRIAFLQQVGIQREGLLLLCQQLGKPPDAGRGWLWRTGHGSVAMATDTSSSAWANPNIRLLKGAQWGMPFRLLALDNGRVNGEKLWVVLHVSLLVERSKSDPHLDLFLSSSLLEVLARWNAHFIKQLVGGFGGKEEKQGRFMGDIGGGPCIRGSRNGRNRQGYGNKPRKFW
ncbi:hypothetical protein ZIOFF_048153 [Zingiber officinale]|uniref:non-specific serine/threonine protein kinase n=1 Tax=Zingiber officinale TaxID=94328 RepID=A0A8J5FYQ5_ZINOF|nr:hypothetical protein ZIOFF_048153 [Zingiber officinale]